MTLHGTLNFLDCALIPAPHVANIPTAPTKPPAGAVCEVLHRRYLSLSTRCVCVRFKAAVYRFTDSRKCHAKLGRHFPLQGNPKCLRAALAFTLWISWAIIPCLSAFYRRVEGSCAA